MSSRTRAKTRKRVRGNLAAGAITATELAAGTITADKIVANSITSGQTQGRSRCRIKNSAGWSTTNNTNEKLTWDSESWDIGGLHDTTVGNNTGIVVPASSGTWLFIAHITWNANGTGVRSVTIFKDGSTWADQQRAAAVVGGEATSQIFMAMDTDPAAAYYEVVVRQTSGGGLGVSAASSFSAVHLW